MNRGPNTRPFWHWAIFGCCLAGAAFSLYWNTFVYWPKLLSYRLFWGDAYLQPSYGERVRDAAAFHPELQSDAFMQYAYQGLLKALDEGAISHERARLTLDSWDEFLPSNPFVLVWPGKIYAYMWLREKDSYDYEAAISYFERARSLSLIGFPPALYDLHAMYFLNGDTEKARKIQAQIESRYGPMTDEQKRTFIR